MLGQALIVAHLLVRRRRRLEPAIGPTTGHYGPGVQPAEEPVPAHRPSVAARGRQQAGIEGGQRGRGAVGEPGPAGLEDFRADRGRGVIQRGRAGARGGARATGRNDANRRDDAVTVAYLAFLRRRRQRRNH